MQPRTIHHKLAAVIIQEYPKTKGTLDGFDLLPQGLFNENAKLLVDGQTFVLKKLSASRSIERHRYGATLQKVLAENDFPCPTILVNNQDDVITELDGHMWSIQTWAEGRSCSSENKNGPEGKTIRANIGSALGRLHTLASTAQQQEKLSPAPDDAQLTFNNMLTRVVTNGNGFFSGSLLRPSKAKRLKLSLKKTALQKDILAMLPHLEKGCRQLGYWDPSPHKSLLKTSACHGDINWENLFFEETRLVAVLDFDNAMNTSPVYDAIAAAAVVCGTDAEYLAAFFESYNKASGMAIDEALIPPLMLLKYVRSLLYQIGMALSDGTGNDAMASQWMAFLSQNIAQLVDE